jgi:hypothetical protein
MDDPILRFKMALKVPIKHGDEIITDIELIEPTLEGLMMIDRANGDIERTIFTIAACTGLPPSVVKQIRHRDMVRINAESGKIMGEDRETGESLPPGSLINSTGHRVN